MPGSLILFLVIIRSICKASLSVRPSVHMYIRPFTKGFPVMNQI